MMFNKVLIAAPAGFPIRDPGAVAELLRGVDPSRDLVFGHGVLDVLDHAAATPGLGGKLLIDATRATVRHMLPSSQDASTACGDGRRPVDELKPFGARFDPAAEGLTQYEKLWLGLANIDPARDIKISDGVATVDCRAKTSVHPDYHEFSSKMSGCKACDDAETATYSNVREDFSGGRNAADGRFSRKFPSRWPNVVVMDEETVALVDERWAEYGLGTPLPSPSTRYRKLLISDGAEV
jgi:4-hydroxy-3-polyprenylbenzoate decarboxylase